MAIVLQALSARLGLASGLDLAQACRARFSKPAVIALWLVAEAAIAATDLAEIIGTAIGLQLLFGMPLAVGIAVTLLDTFVVLAFERAGFRKIELFVVSLLGLIAFSFHRAARDGACRSRAGRARHRPDAPVARRSAHALSRPRHRRRDCHAA